MLSQHLLGLRHYPDVQQHSNLDTLESITYSSPHSRALHLVTIFNMRRFSPTIGFAVAACLLTSLATLAYAAPNGIINPTPPATISNNSPTHAAHWGQSPKVPIWTAGLVFFDIASAVCLVVLYLRKRVYYGTDLVWI